MSMEILNASHEVVAPKHGGATYIFKPGERKIVDLDYVGRHLLNRWKSRGLIDITFTKNVADKYVDQEFYVQAQRIEGLNNVLMRLLMQKQGFENYELESGDKPSVELIHFRRQLSKVNKEIEKVKGLLAEAESVDPKKLLKDKATTLREKAAKLLAEAKQLDGNNTGKSEIGGS